MKTRFPAYLEPGDKIGIMCPAGYMKLKDTEDCVRTLKSWGFSVKMGRTVGGKSGNYFSAPDEKRRNELQKMLDDKSLKAILFARGGYGTSRIIDSLDFSVFKKHPKWLIGFSDITVLLNHVYSNFRISALHASMANAFKEGKGKNISVVSMREALLGHSTSYRCPGHRFNKPGKAKGIMMGGNLAMLVHAIGTDSDFDPKNKILFLEDIGEYIYNIDRMFLQLKRSGKLKGLKGMIIGGFTDIKDTKRPFGKSVNEALLEALSGFSFPVAFGFPVSHSTPNLALKTGGYYELSVDKKTTLLTEIDS